MGIWAGIKYALNSTLGTTGFKSLDEMIKDVIANNQDVELTTEKVVDAGTKSTYYSDPMFTYTVPDYIKGNLKIIFTGKFSSTSGYAYIGYTINHTITTNDFTKMDNYIEFNRVTNYKTIEFQIKGNVGDVIRFYVWVGNGSSYPITYKDVNLQYYKQLENGKMKPLGLKSVQQGVAEMQSSTDELTVQIVNVDVNKAFVILSTLGYTGAVITAAINGEGTLTITKSSTGSSTAVSVSWQVIEFY